MDKQQLIGQKIGEYTIEKYISTGESSIIYKAVQDVLDRYVAIKLPLFRHASEPARVRVSRSMTRRLMDEARILSRLEHPNIIPIHNVGTDRLTVQGTPLDVPYYTMRYASVGDLRRRVLDDGPLHHNEAFDVASTLASALDYMHAKRVLHRGLKPQDILFDAHNIPYIANFGLAIYVDAPLRPEDKKGPTSETTIINEEMKRLFETPEIIAPEVWQGEAHSTASDIYAFGCVAYFALCGRFPFPRERFDFDGLKDAHLHQPPPPVTRGNSELPPPMDTVFERVLAKDPADRFETATDFVSSLRQAFDSKKWDIFISHSKLDMEWMPPLLDKLREFGHRTWWDNALKDAGGQEWWDAILANIKRCEVTLLLLSQNSLDSKPCRLEVHYARALGRNVVPVRIDSAIDPRAVRESISRLQMVDMTAEGWAQQLRNSLNTLPDPDPLPEPLPEPPAVPVTEMSRLAERVDSFEELEREMRLSTILELQVKAYDAEYAAQAVHLLQRLISRDDCDPESRNFVQTVLLALGQ